MRHFHLSSYSLGIVSLCVYGSSLLLGRVTRVIYSSLATNVLYMNTVWPLVFQVVAFLMDLISISSAFGFIPQSMKRYRKQGAFVSFILFSSTQILYALSGFIIDLWSGSISGRESYAIANTGISLILPVGSALFCLVFSFLMAEKKPFLTSVLSCLFYFLCHMGSIVYEIVSFLYEYHYPTTEEVNSMIVDVVTCIIHSGVVVFSLCVFWIFIANRTRGGSKVENN